MCWMVGVRGMILMRRGMGLIWLCECQNVGPWRHEDMFTYCFLRGALEPQFFAALLKGLDIEPQSLPGPREDRESWPALADLFTSKFKSKDRAEWESIFQGMHVVRLSSCSES